MTDEAQDSPNNDWLKFDPLGLDEIEDELDDELLDEELIAEPLRVFTDDNKTNDTTHQDVVMEAEPDSASKPMSNIDMPDAQMMQPIEAMTNNPMLDTDTDSNIATNIIEANLIEANVETDAPKFDGDTSRANPHFKPLLPQPIHRHESNRQLIMDTETTGLDPLKGDRIIEVGIVEMIGRKFTGEKLHVYINPQRGMDDEVIRIHGISNAFLTDKPTFDQVAQSLYDFMDGAEIIAHNASFDMNFLNMEFAKVGMNDFAARVQVTDSLAMAKQQYPGQKNTLDALVRRLNVGKQDRTFHGALLDSEILAEVYLAMTGGQVTLGIEEDTQADGGQTAHANFANLATLLLESSMDENTNQEWYAALAEAYPELKANM